VLSIVNMRHTHVNKKNRRASYDVNSVVIHHGGTLKVAILTNCHQHTVERWLKKGVIPRKYHSLLGIPSAMEG
jgi:DNA invertase Pin-like site-specific DNA recombinase